MMVGSFIPAIERWSHLVSRPRPSTRGPVSGQLKHRMKWITFEVRFAGILGRCFGATLP
jgi:hypothetical protein